MVSSEIPSISVLHTYLDYGYSGCVSWRTIVLTNTLEESNTWMTIRICVSVFGCFTFQNGNSTELIGTVMRRDIDASFQISNEIDDNH